MNKKLRARTVCQCRYASHDRENVEMSSYRCVGMAMKARGLKAHFSAQHRSLCRKPETVFRTHRTLTQWSVVHVISERSFCSSRETKKEKQIEFMIIQEQFRYASKVHKLCPIRTLQNHYPWSTPVFRQTIMVTESSRHGPLFGQDPYCSQLVEIISSSAVATLLDSHVALQTHRWSL